MSEHDNFHVTSDYRDWHITHVDVRGQRFKAATKPGVLAHGRVDIAAKLLTDHVAIKPGNTFVFLNCGSGLLGAVAEARDNAARVFLIDRNIVSVEAARRTCSANALAQTEVIAAAGTFAMQTNVRASVVAIRIPPEKSALHQLLFDAFNILEVDGACYIAGATNEGAKSAEQALKRIFGNARVVAHDSGHRIVVSFKRTANPVNADDIAHVLHDSNAYHQVHTTLRGQPITLFNRPGVFSWDHADEATEILAATMEVSANESVLDLGCGAGALGVVASRLSGASVVMVDADTEAVRCAQKTAHHAGLNDFRVHGSDITLAVQNERFDVVVTNPPFHVGKATDLRVPLQFIHESWEVLNPNGRLYLVANRTLPYERAIAQRFGSVNTVHDGQRFKVLSAHKAG